MEALSRPASTGAPAANASSAAISGNTGAQSTVATGRAHAVPPALSDSGAVRRSPPSAGPLRRSMGQNPNLQSEVARAQQAID